jgi:predicted nucleotide-binding protein (sugar kinase/HSP70/actin superfamily)
MGVGAPQARRAFALAVEELREFHRRKRELGAHYLATLAADPKRFAVVLFGRSYNAFAPEANLGIPEKFASRGVMVVPFDCLDFVDFDITRNMNWAIGQDLMKASSPTSAAVRTRS